MKTAQYYRLMKNNHFVGFKRIRNYPGRTIVEYLDAGDEIWRRMPLDHDPEDSPRLTKPPIGCEHLKTEKRTKRIIDENLSACMIPGNTIQEIESHIEFLDYKITKKLLAAYGCSITDLAYRIAKAKGIKCSRTTSPSETSTGTTRSITEKGASRTKRLLF